MLRILVLLAATTLGGPVLAETYYRNVSQAPGSPAAPSAGSNDAGSQPGSTLTATGPASSAVRTGRAFATPQPQATGATGAVSWAWGPGATPPWATVSPATGVVSGPASGEGSFPNLTLRATDAAGSRLTAPFSIDVLPLPAVSLPTGAEDTRLRVGTALDLRPSATGVRGAQTWSMASFTGTMPPGSGFDSGSGRISGPVTGAGSARFSLVVSDGFDNASSPGAAVALTAYPALAFTAAPGDLSGTVGSQVTRPAPGLAGLSGRVGYGLTQGATDVAAKLSTTCAGLQIDAATGTISGTPQSACSMAGLSLTASDDGAGRAGMAANAASGTFSITVTAPVASSQKFSATGSNVSLSNNNLTATLPAGSPAGAYLARAANAISGKGYFEVTVKAMTAASNVGIGVVSAGSSLNNYIGSDPSGVATYQSGSTYYGGGTSFIGKFVQGDVIMVAYSNGEIWFGKNGTWGRNPTTDGGTGTGTANIPAVSLNAGTAVTANFSSVTAYPVPAGFSTLP